jgi:hypothetical protein
VALDQLVRVRAPTAVRRQAEFLADHGIGALVDDARRRWHERAAVADLDSLAARSRVLEAEALLDPSGLGGFAAAEWELA